MNCSSYEDFFRNFSNPTKLKIIMALKGRAMSVGAISEAIAEEQSKVSHNLTKLAKCSVVSVEKEGKQRIYSLNKETVIPMIALVGRHVEKHCDGRCR